MVDLLQVDVGEDKFMVTGVDHCGSVRACKYVGSRQRLEGT